METILYVLFVAVCVFLVVLVLVQQGKGAGVGFSMGGASQAMFGGSGGRDFFIQLTAALAAAFMVICIILAKIAVSDAGAYRGALSTLPPPAPAGAAAPGLPTGAPGAPLPAGPASSAPPAAPAVPVAAPRPMVPAAPAPLAPAPVKP